MSQPPASSRCPRSWLGEHHDHHQRRTQWVVALAAGRHLWRLGPGQSGLIATLKGPSPGTADQYREALALLPQLRHITIETSTA